MLWLFTRECILSLSGNTGRLTAQNLPYIIRSGVLAYNINMFQYLKIMRHAFIKQAKFIVRGLLQIEISTLNVIVTPRRGGGGGGWLCPWHKTLKRKVSMIHWSIHS